MRKHSSWVAMLAGVVLVAVALAAPVSAHHGWEDYQDSQFEITGTLDDARQSCRAACHGDDESQWRCVGRGARPVAAYCARRPDGGRHPCWRRGDRKRPPASRRATLEIKTERLTWNGKVFNVYPDRN